MLGKFLDLDLAYENNAAVDVLLNGKMALSVSLPFVQEIYCRRAVELDDNTVAYDDLRERFIQFDQLIANDHRLPFIVRGALVWVETSRTNWVSARRVGLCLVTGRKPTSVSCPEVLALFPLSLILVSIRKLKFRIVTTLAEKVTRWPDANECAVHGLPFGFVVGVFLPACEIIAVKQLHPAALSLHLFGGPLLAR